MAHQRVLGRLAAAAAIVLGTVSPARAVPGPHAVTDVSQALVRAYNAEDAAGLHALLAPALQARYGIEALQRALLLCRVLTSEIFRISTPVWGARHFGYFAVYAETKPFEMILEIDDDGRIVHWVITDDVQATEQQCQLTHRD